MTNGRRRHFANNGCAITLLAIVPICFCLGLGPIKGKTQNESLAGIQSVYVIVNIGLSREGPTKKGLLEEVEKQLQKGGLQILEDIDEEMRTSVPIFNVDVAIWKNADKPYIYFVHANFYQPVHLVRDQKFETQAATWQAGMIGSGMLDRIRADVTKISKNFVRNVKKATQEKSDIQ